MVNTTENTIFCFSVFLIFCQISNTSRLSDMTERQRASFENLRPIAQVSDALIPSTRGST
jgi:hypothetical protein